MPTASSEPRGFAAPLARFELPRVEEEILAYWREHEIQARSLDTSPTNKPAFVFYDGPPFATGLPHYGHLLAGTIKDIVPRYWAMRGHVVERRFGWDCHGLPIESLVERQLSLSGRADIEAYGVDRFNAACRAGVLRYTDEWRRVVERMGRWVDFDDDYKTMDASFMESVWWVFRQLWDRNLIYEGHRVQPVSPALGTPLSNFEVAQGPQERDPVTRKEGHKRRQDPSLTVRFRLEDEDANLWAWTTTPWTLPSNLALAVHPDVIYAKVRVIDTGEIAYIEPTCLARYQERQRVGATEELGRVSGRELVDRPYQPLLPYFAEHAVARDGHKRAFRVVLASYVTTDSGTGIVHQAPAFGEDDFQVGQREGLPLINPLDLNGVFDSRVSDFAGQFAKDADKGIIERLKGEDKLVDQDTIVHPYPHCYRSEQPLLYMAISTWFMRVESLRDRLVAHNQPIHWVPDHVGSGRFGNWLAAARDWNLSRNRYWGTPLPVWRCDNDPSDMVCVGSIAELEKLADLEPGTIRDLHRESIDSIAFPSARTPGGTMRRIKEVFDCWFESGSMPYAQNHYPFNRDKVEYVENNLPADFIAEGLDQTRGWFYTLHVLATALFDRPAFRNVIVNGLILAADGKKMSKRLNNYPDPTRVIETYGADALRAYLINSPVVRAEPMRFGKHAQDTSGEAVRDTVRLAVLPLWNAYNFFVTYARADGWKPADDELTRRPAATCDLDRWLLSRLHSFLSEIQREFEAYALSNLVPAYLRLCDDLNNWYIRRGRRRYWRSARTETGAETDGDKQQAYETLYRVLVSLVHAIAPMFPFFSEYLYQRLVVDLDEGRRGSSVHLQRFPRPDESLRDATLENDVARVREAIALGLSLREGEKIGVRRPLSSVTIASTEPATRAALQRFESELRGELNVKRVEILADDSTMVQFSAKANFKVLGKRLGKRMKTVAAAVTKLDAAALQPLLAGGSIDLEGETLHADDVVLHREPLPGRVVESANGITVVLDTTLHADLVAEGLARELVTRIQNLRKQAELDVSARIEVGVAAGSAFADVLANDALSELIRQETLANGLVGGAPDLDDYPHRHDDEIDGHAVTIALKPVSE
ncbi:MAG: isoleucine--tRNA ligase [Myxococcales bacterium FL481]|nr:MAG: isoleucine--tRNA ligase [Myxococcales bacterium FL481]